MKGSEAQLVNFIEGANNRYIVPVYQRKYDWHIDNCQQLYTDLVKIIDGKRSSHFFGSIVSDVVPSGANIEFHIIDGQQRLTTVTLLLLAIANLIRKGLIVSEQNELDNQILERFIVSKWAKEDEKIKLKPVRSDRAALAKLVAADEEEYDYTSNLTINYKFFCDQLLRGDIKVDDVYDAISKLQIISITLDHEDNPQLIFESLNSTGLALTEGDKIRNYVLMGLSPLEQEEYFDKYWSKIESNVGKDVSQFIRDYLSIKQLITPAMSAVYAAFKSYVSDSQIPIQLLLEDLTKYSRFYGKLVSGKSGLNNKDLDDCMYRLTRLEITVTEPFLMEVLRLNFDGKLSVDEVRDIFAVVETYLFRRNICDVQTNALNKIFLYLNKEIIRYDNSTDNYVEKFIYALLNKKESGRFPNDEEFSDCLASKQVYLMRGRYKAYLFERFENYGTIETKDIYTHLDNGTYSIEHIMPQHLSPAWNESLGVEAENIHITWLHRLGNLTLTGYNSNMSNSSFIEKRDAEKGFKESGLRMNQKIAQKSTWGVKEMQERSDEMVDTAIQKIWPFPSSSFQPAEKEYDSCTLDDEDFELKGRDIIKYSYLNVETPVASWIDMYEHVVKYLHEKDKSVLYSIAYASEGANDLANYFSGNEATLRSSIKIDNDIYAEKNTSTTLKISILRRLFALYKADALDLVFYLKDVEENDISDGGRYKTRRKYWEYALPLIKESNTARGLFGNTNTTQSNYLSTAYGVGGFGISCVANFDQVKVDFYFSKKESLKNKEAFDYLFNHKAQIEEQLGVQLEWERGNDNKSSWIFYRMTGVSIGNESDWLRMSKFHAEWSKKMSDVILTYLKELYPDIKS